MNHIISSQVAPNFWRSFQGNAVPQSIQGNRIVCAIASLAIVLFALSGALLAVYLARAHLPPRKNNFDLIKPDPTPLTPPVKSPSTIDKNDPINDQNDPINDQNDPINDQNDLLTPRAPIFLTDDLFDEEVFNKQNNFQSWNKTSDISEEILDLEDELKSEKEMLNLLDDKSDILVRIQELQSRLDLALKIYARKESKKYPSQDSSTTSLNSFKNLLDYSGNMINIKSLKNFLENNATNEKILIETFIAIDKFLADKVFEKKKGKLNLPLDENDRGRFKSFQELFPVFEEHISFIEKKDPSLAARLKIKCANLPNTEPRVKYSKLFLNETKQLMILIDHFQEKENAKIDELIWNLKDICQEDIKIIANFAVEDKSPLNNVNRAQLQSALKKMMGDEAPETWAHYDDVLESLRNNFQKSRNQSKVAFKVEKIVEKLWRMSIAKHFFADQVGRRENEIQIPRWYHATKHSQYTNFFDPILKEGKIQVMHKGMYRGAWVSNQREVDYGDSVFAFSHRIETIDPFASIQTRNNRGVRWRGLQKPIPFIQSPESSQSPQNQETFLSLIGIRLNGDEKEVREKVIKQLEKKKIKNPTIFSVAQVDYIHKNIFKAIGCPNLSDKWWG